ncbi:MAG TPA: sulfate permease [Chthonomonadales bacterium]|nr:sulfate permease [Chthonomonadales bacterium]
MTGLERVLPALAWLRGYRREDLAADLSAGASVAVLLVPQSMAYALLAGLPPAAGLYAASVPVAVYALFGTSRHLAVGPVAILSLLTQRQAAAVSGGDPAVHAAVAIELALLVGVLQMAMGALRLGVLVHFLSHAVITGFASAAAILIMLSQLPHLLGVERGAGGAAFESAADLLSRASGLNPATLALGAGCIAVMLALRRWWPRAPAALAAVAVGTVAVAVAGLESAGVATMGSVPSGLPPFGLPPLEAARLPALLPAALTIAVIGFVEATAIANVIAARERYRVDASRELAALGLANVAASACGAYPVTGGLARTAVNHQAGARTGMASLVTAALVLLSMVALTPAFYHTPMVALAAVVMVSVPGLVNVREFRHLLRLKPSDALALAVTFVATLALEVEAGIAVGVAFSLLMLVWRAATPRVVEVGLVEEEGAFRDIARFPGARRFEDVLIVRVDSALYFPTMRHVEARLRASLAARPVRWVVFDLSSVGDMDAVAVSTLEEWMRLFGEQGVRFAFAGTRGPVKDLLERAGWEREHSRQITVRQTLIDIGALPASEPGARSGPGEPGARSGPAA